MSRLFMSFCCLFILLVSARSIAEIITTPAFNEAARQSGADGGWRISEGTAHYNRSQYLFQLGYGFLYPETTNSPSSIVNATSQTPAQNPQIAATLLGESVATSPGNAQAWASLAWAHALGGQISPARDAMAVSWKLAPHDLALASSRLAFVEYVADTGTPNKIFELQEFEHQGALSDFQTLTMHNPDAAEAKLGNSNRLQLIIQDQS